MDKVAKSLRNWLIFGPEQTFGEARGAGIGRSGRFMRWGLGERCKNADAEPCRDGCRRPKRGLEGSECGTIQVMTGRSHESKAGHVARTQGQRQVQITRHDGCEVPAKGGSQPLVLGGLDAQHPGLACYLRQVPGAGRHHHQPAAGPEHPRELGGVARGKDYGDGVDGVVRDRKRLPDIPNYVQGLRVQSGGPSESELGNVQTDGRRHNARTDIPHPVAVALKPV